MLKRLLLLLGVTALTLLLAESVHSLVTGRSLRSLPALARLAPGLAAPAPTSGVADSEPPPRAPPTPPTDDERHSSEGATGPYRIHEDPRVRHVLRADAEVTFVGVPAHTNHLGLRVRPGPPPPDDALRIAVVGDSVAFGHGVADDQTQAAQLERQLAAARGPDARPIACFTIAVPSWNHRNALACLTDHWDELRPDIVVYVPISNDLGDTAGVYESGSLRIDADPAQPDPFLLVSRIQLTSLEDNLPPQPGRPALDTAFLGPYAIEADLTPESSRRYDDNAASIIEMSRLLARHGGHLIVVKSGLSEYAWHLFTRLQRLEPELPLLLLERWVPREFTLVKDAHPNATSLGVRATWVAEELLRRGWVDRGAGNPLPEIPAAYAETRGQEITASRVAELSVNSHRQSRDELLDEIDFTTGKGLRQVIGGLNLDRSVRMHALCVLKANGASVDLVLGPLPGRSDLYPLRVDVELAGTPAGSVVIEAGEITRVTLPLPASVARGDAFEVKLIPATWCIVNPSGRSQAAACVPIRMRCTTP